jgi:hypothetical protein
MMETNELSRKPVDVFPGVDVESELYKAKKVLAEKGRQLFNYSKYSSELSDKYDGPTNRASSTALAAEAFAKVGLEPLDDEKVIQYKNSVVNKMNLSHRFQNFCVEKIGKAIMHTCGWSYLIGTAFLLGFAVAYTTPANHAPLHWLWRELYFVPLLAAWVTIAIVRDFTNHIKWTYEWKAVSLCNYNSQPIPEFALAHAIALYEAVRKIDPNRNAEFYVDFLTARSEDMNPPPPDPFLVMKLGKEIYYVDVWEEHSFEARKVV